MNCYNKDIFKKGEVILEGKKYLKFAGIILVIFGIGQLLLACLAFAGGGIAALGINAGGDNSLAAAGTTAIIGGVIMVVNAAFNLIFGIMAVRNCENPGKAKALRVMGVVLLVLSIVSLITHFSSGLAAVISCIIDLIISIIYFAGAQKNLKTL